MEGVPPTLRLKAGVRADEVEFGELGYAEAAAESYAAFEQRQRAGEIPSDVRFQVSLPTPLANSWAWFGTDPQFAALHERYTEAYHREVDAIVARIPSNRLCLQWDVCVEVWLYEGWVPVQARDAKELCVAHVAQVGNWVPDDVDLGFHLCYGDWQHEHLRQPEDLANVVSLVNGFLGRIDRQVAYVHIPVPIDRDDQEFFAPAQRLELPDGCELYLGLVHMRDGEQGARRRIAAAQGTLENFGVATECGMGRRPADRGGSPDTLKTLLELHRTLAEPVR
jgi:methionine synthase II (cobalamin-independent)